MPRKTKEQMEYEKRLQVNEYCAKLREELGITPAKFEYEEWNSLFLTDERAYILGNERAVAAVSTLRTMVTPESAKIIEGKKLNKMLGKHCAGVTFDCGLDTEQLFKYMNGEKIIFPRTRATFTNVIPLSEREYFSEYDVTEDGRIELEFGENNESRLEIDFPDYPSKGEVQFPVRLRTGDIEPKKFHIDSNSDYDHYTLIEIDTGYRSLECYVFVPALSYVPMLRIMKVKVGKDDEGLYLDAVLRLSSNRW